MLAKKYVFFLSSNLFSVFLGYIAIFLISRFLGPSPLGIIGFAFSYVGLFAVLNDFGFFTAHIKMVSEGKNLGKCIGTMLFLRIILSILLSVIAIGSLVLWKQFVGGLEHSSEEWAIFLILFSVIIDGFSNVLIFSFQARHEIAKMQLPLIASAIIRVVAIAITVFFSLSVIVLAFCYVLGALTQLIAALWLSKGLKISLPDRQTLKLYLNFAAPLAIAAVFSAIYLNIDKILIQFFFNSKEVGLYYGSQKLGEIFNVLSAAIMALLIPAFSMYSIAEQKIKSKALLFESERMMSLFLFPLIALIFVFSRQIISLLLGSKFIEAQAMLFVLSLAAFLNALNKPYSAKLVGTSNQKLYAKISILVMFSTISMELLLVPQALFGVKLPGLNGLGASIALCIGMILAGLLLRYYCHKKLQTGFNKKPLIHLIAAAIMSGIMIAILQFSGQSIEAMALTALIGLAAYFGLLSILSEFGKKEISIILNAVNPKAMASYVKSEI